MEFINSALDLELAFDDDDDELSSGMYIVLN